MKKIKPNLYIVSPTCEISGVLTHVNSLSRLSLNNIEKSIVVLPISKEHPSLGLPDNIEIDISYSIKALPKTWISTWKFVESTSKYDIIHLHGRLSLIAFAPAIILKRRKFFYTFHQFFNNEQSFSERLKNSIEIKLAKKMTNTISVSRPLQKQVWDRFKVSSQFIPNWLSKEAFLVKSENCIKREKSNLIYLGRFAPEKNPIAALNAVNRLKPKVTLDMYGAGPLYHDLIDKISALEIKKWVKIHSPTKRPFKTLDRYRCIIIPSVSESFGLVALEAFARGVFVIAPDIPGIKETLNGFQYIALNPNSRDSIDHAITQYLSLSEEEIDRSTDYNLDILKQRYSEASVSRLYEKFYSCEENYD